MTRSAEMSQARSWEPRTRRLVWLSSTTRTRSPWGSFGLVRGGVPVARRPGEGKLEPEGAAMAELAVDADGAAHGLRQPPADGQAEPGAAVAAGGRGVGLGERLEQPLGGLRGDADAGVEHLHAHVTAPVAGRGRPSRPGSRPRPRLGELHRIRGQVQQDLAEATRRRPGTSWAPRAWQYGHQLQALGAGPTRPPGRPRRRWPRPGRSRPSPAPASPPRSWRSRGCR